MSGSGPLDPLEPGLDADGDTKPFERVAHDAQARTKLVGRYRGLAESLARPYQGYGEPLEDLVGVASIGLIGPSPGQPAEGAGGGWFRGRGRRE
jgi:hypothetical protein